MPSLIPTGCSRTAAATRRCLLDEFQSEGAADAGAHDVKPIDAEVVEEGELVSGVGAPGVFDLERPCRSSGVALVHGDESEVVGIHR